MQQRPRPAHHTYGYDTKRLGNIEPATAFGLTNNYGNDKYNGYTLVKKNEVNLSISRPILVHFNVQYSYDLFTYGSIMSYDLMQYQLPT